MNDISYEIEMTQNTIDVKAKQYSELKDTNLAIQIAKKIQGSIPVIYSASDGFESVNTRWVRQIQENAKQLVFNGLLPEMNHNEINSFSNPDILPKKISLIYIKDEADNPRTKIRFNALKEIIGKQVKQIIEIQSTEQNALSRMFDLLYLGDWVSYYLAILNEIDPTPIPLITKLKDYLSQF
jgi:glucose/mannose-6-phosphate isomerase